MIVSLQFTQTKTTSSIQQSATTTD